MKAFPRSHSAEEAGGMELRDYFASKVIVGLIPIYRDMFMDNTFEDWGGGATATMVEDAYAIADEMMEARKK